MMRMELVNKMLNVLGEYDNAYDMLKQFVVLSEYLDKDQLASVMWGVHARMCDEFEDTMWEEARKADRKLD